MAKTRRIIFHGCTVFYFLLNDWSFWGATSGSYKPYGELIAFIEIPDDARVFVEDEDYYRFKADKFIVKTIISFDEFYLDDYFSDDILSVQKLCAVQICSLKSYTTFIHRVYRK